MKKIHPGQILHMELVEGRNLTISKIAELLGTTRANFSNIINGHASISPKQRSYDLAKAKADFLINTPNLKRYEIA